MSAFPVRFEFDRKALTPLMLVLLAFGCATQSSRGGESLFLRMGGMPTVSAIADEIVDVVAADPKTSRSFEGIKLPTLKHSIAQQLCRLADGPCKYDGESMKKAHTGLKITDTEFDRLVAATRAALDRRVGEREKNEMLRLLAPMKRDIVGA